MESELTKNKHIAEVEDIIIYQDMANYMQFEIIEINGNNFVTKEIETGNEEDRNFNFLQYGWRFKDRAKLINEEMKND